MPYLVPSPFTPQFVVLKKDAAASNANHSRATPIFFWHPHDKQSVANDSPKPHAEKQKGQDL